MLCNVHKYCRDWITFIIDNRVGLYNIFVIKEWSGINVLVNEINVISCKLANLVLHKRRIACIILPSLNNHFQRTLEIINGICKNTRLRKIIQGYDKVHSKSKKLHNIAMLFVHYHHCLSRCNALQNRQLIGIFKKNWLNHL